VLGIIFDLIFPKKCVNCKKYGSFLCASCFALVSFETSLICPVCNKNSIDGLTHKFCKKGKVLDGLVSGVVYKGVVKKIIYQFKYKPYLSKLKKIISKLLCEALSQSETFYKFLELKPVIACVPLYRRKEMQRGYNHSALLAFHVAQYFNLQFVDKALIRTKDTKPQFNLKKEERFENIKGTFEINKKLKNEIMGQDILVIDDLATTCATLNECAKVLKQNGAKKVLGVVFAREN